MATIKFSKDHEWISVEGDTGTVGITDYAQGSLGDIVFVEVPEVGATFSKGDDAAVVESVKAASELYAPVSGQVTETNNALADDPAIVNSSPTDEGWFFKIKLSDPSELDELMDKSDYNDFIETLS